MRKKVLSTIFSKQGNMVDYQFAVYEPVAIVMIHYCTYKRKGKWVGGGM